MPEHGCPRIAEGFELCGLLFGHAGPCVPFMPGDYLPPVLLHPLYGLRPTERWQCPVCAGRIGTFPVGEFLSVFRGGQANWDRPSDEMQFTFHPCRCMVRVVDLT